MGSGGGTEPSSVEGLGLAPGGDVGDDDDDNDDDDDDSDDGSDDDGDVAKRASRARRAWGLGCELPMATATFLRRRPSPMRFMAEPLKRRRNASSLGRARSSSSGGADTPATDTAPNAGDHVIAAPPPSSPSPSTPPLSLP